MLMEIGTWLWLAVGAAVWLIVVPGRAALLRLSVARRGHRRRLELGPPVAATDFADGARAVLEGRLETGGATVPSLGDGMPVATSSLVVDDGWEGRVLVHDQAAGLSLSTGGVSVDLQGRLELQVGTCERHGLDVRGVARRILSRLNDGAHEVGDRLVVRSVSPSDRVRIAGWLRRVSAVEDGALYRQSAGRWRLVPDHDGGTLALVSASRPRVSGPVLNVWLRRSFLTLALYVLAVAAAGRLAYDARLLELATLSPFHRMAAIHDWLEQASERAALNLPPAPVLERPSTSAPQPLSVRLNALPTCDGIADAVARRMCGFYLLYGSGNVPLFPISALERRRSVVLPFRTTAGECRAYVAVWDQAAMDLEVTIRTPDGDEHFRRSFGGLLITTACSLTTGTVSVELRTTRGGGTVGLQSFVRPARDE